MESKPHAVTARRPAPALSYCGAKGFLTCIFFRVDSEYQAFSFFAANPMVVDTFNSIGANFRMISSNSALRLRNTWVSVSRRYKTSRNSRFWRKMSRAASNRSNIARNSSSVTGFAVSAGAVVLGG